MLSLSGGNSFRFDLMLNIPSAHKQTVHMLPFPCTSFIVDLPEVTMHAHAHIHKHIPHSVKQVAFAD